MLFATMEKELKLNAPNKIGVVGKINSLIAKDAKTNIKAFWAGVEGNHGRLAFITNDNNKVKQVLKDTEFNQYQEDEVVVIRTKDQVGSAAEVTKKIADAGVNIQYICTTLFDGEPSIVVYSD